MTTIGNHRKQLIVLLLVVAGAACGNGSERPERWAQPIAGSDLTNLYKVDDTIYRCEQPNANDLKFLSSIGVRTVLNLRTNQSDNGLAADTNLELRHASIQARSMTLTNIVDALQIIKRSEGPILIHCYHGSDRTGAVVAAYRIVFQRWTVDDAVAEMLDGGYGFHMKYRNIIRLLRRVDWDSVRNTLGNGIQNEHGR